MFRHEGETVIHQKNKRRKSNNVKYRRTGKALKAGDKIVLYASLGNGCVKNFIIYLNGTRFCWPQIIKYLPYPLAFAVSIANVNDKVRILPNGIKGWIGDYISRSGRTMVRPSEEEEATRSIEPTITQEEGDVVENEGVLPLGETAE